VRRLLDVDNMRIYAAHWVRYIGDAFAVEPCDFDIAARSCPARENQSARTLVRAKRFWRASVRT
jgi:hypothetical protein